MNKTIQILLVEDDDMMVHEWREAVATHNSDSQRHGLVLESVVAASYEAAIQAIRKHKFDAAIVDLRLRAPVGEAGPNSDGNRVIAHIADTSTLAISVYSGQSSEFDREHSPREVEVFDRGAGLDQVFTWIGRQREMIVKLQESREIVERQSAKVFFTGIWPRWKNWAEATPSSNETPLPITRHMIAHVHDSLSYAAEAYHFEESYFVPPVKPSLDTGDLVEVEGDIAIVVTPRCDLANDNKTATILLARCEDLRGRWTSLIGAGSKSAVSEMSSLQKHKGSFNRHFLPPMRDHNGADKGPWFVCFDNLVVLDCKTKRAELTAARLASLAPQFVPSLVERFGAYFSRIGTPILSGDEA